MKRFSDLTEQEVLALAITNEEEDSRIYRGFAEGLRAQFPSSAKVFDEMAEEEVVHRSWLFDLYRKKFGDYLPLIRRQDVKGFIHHKSSLWLMRPLGLEEVRKRPGYHDEPLLGDRRGQRSIRLNRSWRAIYVILSDGRIEFVEVQEVNKHEY